MGSFDHIPDAAPAGESTPPTPGAFDHIPAAQPETEEAKRALRADALKRMVQANSAPASTLGNVNTRIGDAGSFSVVRPIGAAVSAAATGVTGDYPGTTFGERYQAHYGAATDRAEQASKDLGWAGVPIDIAASIPANVAMGGAKVLTPAKNILTSAGQGFIEGASQNADSVGGAIWGGLKKGTTDAITTAGLNKVISKFTGSGKKAADDAAKAVRGTDTDELKTAAKALYSQMDNQGIGYSNRQLSGLVQDLDQLSATSKLRMGDKTLAGPHAAVTDIYQKLAEYSKSGATFNQLHDLRSALATQARGQDENARDAASIVIGRLDNLIHNHAPAINPRNVDVGKLHPEASRLWKAASLAEDVGWVADKAKRNAEWRGGNPDKANRGAFAAVRDRADKPGGYDPFNTQEQRDLLAQIVEGTKGQNRRANIGENLRTNANTYGVGAAGLASGAGMLKGLDASASLAPASYIGVPVALGARWGGKALQRSADTIGQENVNKLMRNITTGTSDLPEYASKLGRDELAKLQFNQLLARMAPQIAGR